MRFLDFGSGDTCVHHKFPAVFPRFALNGFILIGLISACCFIPGSPWAAVLPEEQSRFDPLVIFDPSTALGIIAEEPEALAKDAVAGFEKERIAWETFIRDHGGKWKAHIDRRSGSPTLVEGQGIRWLPAEGSAESLCLSSASSSGMFPTLSPTQSPAVSLKEFESKARLFVSENSALFRVRESELVLNQQGSGLIDKDHWLLVFDRAVNGIPVEDQHFIMYVTRGNLVAFGADRWGSPAPDAPKEIVFDAALAREVLLVYMGIMPSDQVEEIEPGKLAYVSAPPKGTIEGVYTAPQSHGITDRTYAGPVGSGVDLRLAWRFTVRVEEERGIWIGKVDAQTGKVIAFYDDMKYGRVKGGVYPMSNDGQGWEGSEQPGFPMPFADVSIDGQGQTGNDMGLFIPGSASSQAVTNLNGLYVYINEVCGSINESDPADGDIDLLQSSGTDCAVPNGASSGDTHAARTSFYHVNRAKERGRYWLPDNSWLKGKVTVKTNSTWFQCNASWNGNINLYRSTAGICRNFGEISGIEIHEWGHGLDQNDGGGYDNPSEAYADVAGILYDRVSCLGRGSYFGNCSGYGDACQNCTGIRELDWDGRASHKPATADGFVKNNCGSGSGPCGKEVHCEGYLAAETIWDLAARDLPASGLDTWSSFQLAEKLFYRSRQGSGGNAYNCSIPNSDGCGAGTWFTKLRNADDDDGDLSNGTPHAAAIFAAFNRHKIACGAASDVSNQNHSSCPSLAVSALTTTAGCGSVKLNWSAVPNAANYLVLRNDQKCDASSIVIATVTAPATEYVDHDLPSGFTVYYRIQAQGANVSCESAVSACATAAAKTGAPPDEVSGVTVIKTAVTHLSWTSQAAGTRYDVAGGNLSELSADRNFTGAICLADDLTDSQWDDTQSEPSEGDGYYYLVRAETTACGSGTYGWQTGGAERVITACP